MKLILAALLALALAACATTGPSADYGAYLQASVALANAQAVSQETQCPADDGRCAENVAAFRAIAQLAGGNRNQIAPPPQQPSGAEQFARVVGALAPIAGVVANAWVSVEQSNNSVRQSEHQWGAITGIVGTSVNANRDVAIAGLGAASGMVPSINVGGDYVPGTQTQAGRDMLGDGAQVGDRAGDDLASGGSRIDNRVDNSDNSDHSGGNAGTCNGAAGAPGAAAGNGANGGTGGAGGTGGNGGNCSGGPGG